MTIEDNEETGSLISFGKYLLSLFIGEANRDIGERRMLFRGQPLKKRYCLETAD